MPKEPKLSELAVKRVQNQLLGVLSRVSTSALTSSNVTSACTTSLNSYDSPTNAEMNTGHALLATPTQVETACDASLATYDAPTKTELDTSESNVRGADSDTLKTLSDQIDGIGGGGSTVGSRIIINGDCDVGMGASATTIVSADLAGFGNDYFNTKYYMQIALNANSVGNAPENQTRQITDYVSATGTFTVNAFGANVEENDKILVVHESIALMALHADATLAKVADDSWLAHLMAIDGTVADFDDTTDSLEAIADAIAASSGLSTKEKIVLGVYEDEYLRDYFLTVGEATAPDTNIWTTVADNDGHVKTSILNNTGYLLVKSGSALENDSRFYTGTKKLWTLNKGTGNTLYLKTRLKIDDLTGYWAFGFVRQVMTGTFDFISAGRYPAGFKCYNDVIFAVSSDGSAIESTDVSAYLSDATMYDMEVQITSSDVVFKIDGTTRATHTTRVPNYTWQLYFGSKNSANGIQSEYSIEHAEVYKQ